MDRLWTKAGYASSILANKCQLYPVASISGPPGAHLGPILGPPKARLGLTNGPQTAHQRPFCGPPGARLWPTWGPIDSYWWPLSNQTTSLWEVDSLVKDKVWTNFGHGSWPTAHPEFVHVQVMSHVCPTRNWQNMGSVVIQCLSKVCPKCEIKLFDPRLDRSRTNTGPVCPIPVQDVWRWTGLRPIHDRLWTWPGQGQDRPCTWTDVGQGLDKHWTEFGQRLDFMSNVCPAPLCQLAPKFRYWCTMVGWTDTGCPIQK